MRTVLYINWHESKDATRRLEFQKCLDINKTIFDEIVNVSDVHVAGTTFVPWHGRPTYNDFFGLMKKDELSVLSNLDIYFDATLLKKIPSSEECFALTRWDVVKGQVSFYNHADSQDCWIFTNPPKHVEGADFTLGKAGCDNAIAHKLALAGYDVKNPSLTIKTYHLHETAYRTYIQAGKVIERVPPPYKLLTPTV